MSHSLNSIKDDYVRDYIGTAIGVIKGDTRSLDLGSCLISFKNMLHFYDHLYYWLLYGACKRVFLRMILTSQFPYMGGNSTHIPTYYHHYHWDPPKQGNINCGNRHVFLIEDPVVGLLSVHIPEHAPV